MRRVAGSDDAVVPHGQGNESDNRQRNPPAGNDAHPEREPSEHNEGPDDSQSGITQPFVEAQPSLMGRGPGRESGPVFVDGKGQRSNSGPGMPGPLDRLVGCERWEMAARSRKRPG